MTTFFVKAHLMKKTSIKVKCDRIPSCRYAVVYVSICFYLFIANWILKTLKL